MGTFLTPDEAQPRKTRSLDEIRTAAERIDGDWADSCILVLAALIMNLVDYLKAKEEARPSAHKRSKRRG
jgi:hypothetical protein